MTLSDLAMEDDARERARLFALRNPNPSPLRAGVGGFVRLFAGERPDRPAIRHGSTTITYRELRDRVDTLAHAMVARGCRLGDVVAWCDGRVSDVIATFLAAESIGACYLPIDPSWPSARIETALRLSNARLLVARVAEYSADRNGLALLCTRETEKHNESSQLPDREPSPTELRYLIFTSGSTGVPKGATVEQQGMMNHLWAKIHDLQLAPSDVVAFSAPLTFDIAIWQMLAALAVGGVVAVLDDADVRFPRRLLSEWARLGVTVAEVIPSFGELIAQEANRTGAPPHLRWLMTTGEELRPRAASAMAQAFPEARIMNAYGPTECSDDVTHHVVTAADLEAGCVPVGAPIPNAVIYVLRFDEQEALWQAVEPGRAGEIFVGGVPVGQGYAGDPEATCHAFHVDSLDDKSPTARLYRTGDLGYIHDSRLMYLGRTDRQVKVAGVRVELHEIELALAAHPDVRECAVKLVPIDGRGVLVAFFALRQPRTVDEVRAFVSDRVPGIMVPREWRIMERLPRNTSGKIDYQGLS